MVRVIRPWRLSRIYLLTRSRSTEALFLRLNRMKKKLLDNFIDMAGIFGADVCVEGIETSGMRDIIKDYGIHSFQGYYYSKPISIEEFLLKIQSGADCFANQE